MTRNKSKYIFVTGGVVSGLGKGIIASAIGRILKQKGFKIFMQKFDPYVNIDPGLMHPLEHGEVFVTADGAEADLDLGHYERFIDEELSHLSSVSTGKIYQTVINHERRGKYQGQTVQVVPHITNEIKNNVYKAASKSKADVVIVEVGGIAGDIESLPFIEAIRQIRFEKGSKNTLFVHCTLLPYLESSKEYKTKPTQQSIALLRSLGVQPDLIMVRSKDFISQIAVEKISLFCNVEKKDIFQAVDVKNIYESVLVLVEQNIEKRICTKLNLKGKPLNLQKWNSLIKKAKNLKKTITIGVIGKYRHGDSYLSIMEALKAAGYANNCQIDAQFIYSGSINKNNVVSKLVKLNGILVPGGFGQRGTNGKLLAITYARKNKVPFIGICYGMQLSLIEYARNVLGLKNADTTELNPETKYPIIDIIKGKTKLSKSGVLRLGNNQCRIEKNTKTFVIYGSTSLVERHRHKYEFSLLAYQKWFKNSDIIASAFNLQGNLVEIIEHKNHPFFIGCQFHPEFTSRPTRANLLFKAFVKAAI